MRRRYPGFGGMMREMFRDYPEEYRNPEDIDAEQEQEQKEDGEEDDSDEVVDVIPVGSARERQELADAEETLWDLRFGITVLSVLCLLFTFFAKPHWKFICGVVIGWLLAEVLISLIYKSVAIAVSLDPNSAVRYSRKKSALRYFMTFAVLAAVMFFGGITMGAGTVLASFTMKLAAYFQPWFRKLKRCLNK